MSNVEKYCSGIGIVNQVGSTSTDKNCRVPSPNQLSTRRNTLLNFGYVCKNNSFKAQ